MKGLVLPFIFTLCVCVCMCAATGSSASSELSIEGVTNIRLGNDINDDTTHIYATYDKGSQTLTFSSQDSGNHIADGSFFNELASTGWSRLYLNTASKTKNEIEIFAAGYIEGALTNRLIVEFYTNIRNMHKNEGSAMENVYKFFERQIDFVAKKIQAIPELRDKAEQNYWTQVSYSFYQMQGILTGYNAVSNKQIKMADLFLVNSDGEIPELITAFSADAVAARKAGKSNGGSDGETFLGASSMLQEASGNPDTMWELRMLKSHCSALVKLLPDFSDLYIGHTTWDDYSEMIRIFKHYNMPLPGAGTKTAKTIFSSYPGCISSTDDWYVMSSKLVVLETTLEILDESVYQLVDTEHSLANFFRIMAANRLAASAEQWANIFEKYNSGTYNSQWVILDYNKFVPGQQPKPNSGLLWILEQIPGKVEKEDMTKVLIETSYWPSFNRPSFDEIYRRAGFESMVKQYGNIYSKTENPRARIFREKQKEISSFDKMREVMQYNDWRKDLNSEGSPGHAVAPRFDLHPNPTLRRAMGGIDSKITSYSRVKEMTCDAISGPTHVDQPVFSFSTNFADEKPSVLPDSWNFNWVTMQSQS
eukprot:GILK01003809.1.p1 GENE.GILK01003809.1~~GILK01003809.1.p1  ORF type:complete len:592 (-),score=106.68 GILK01003809.1:9-1784(-)